MRVKEESEKDSLKLNIKKKTRSWHVVPSIQGKWKRKGGSSDIFGFLRLRNTVDSDCNHESKRAFERVISLEG